MRYWLTDYELAQPRLENCGKAYLISSIIMANILKYITAGDNILKRQAQKKTTKLNQNVLKVKEFFKTFTKKTLCRCNWRHLADNAWYFVV